MQEMKVKDHSVQKLQWKQTDRQTDGGDCITSRANAVGNFYEVSVRAFQVSIYHFNCSLEVRGKAYSVFSLPA